eukprot:scaffold125840_cov32-Tisochrysis_lutea.AAC.2
MLSGVSGWGDQFILQLRCSSTPRLLASSRCLAVGLRKSMRDVPRFARAASARLYMVSCRRRSFTRAWISLAACCCPLERSIWATAAACSTSASSSLRFGVRSASP